MAEICNRVLKERGVDARSYLDLYLQSGYEYCEILDNSEVLKLNDMINDYIIHGESLNVLLY
jgi:hypothetical protein